LLDLVLPDVSGLALQHELALRGVTIPIIFVTNKGQKSFSNAELMGHIRQAIAHKLSLSQRRAGRRRRVEMNRRASCTEAASQQALRRSNVTPFLPRRIRA
jgi:DNA-binding response OmpR family regulator